MEKKEVYICQQQVNYEEDEIDLRQLFKTIWSHRKFIIIFTSIIAVLSIICAYSIKPVYQINGFLELGYYYNSNSNSNSNRREYFIDPNNALILLQNEFNNKLLPNMDKIQFKRGTKILDLKINGYSNSEDKKYLENIVNYLQNIEDKKVHILIFNIKLKIKNLQQYKINLQQRINSLNNKINSNLNPFIYQALLTEISNLNSQVFNIDNQILDLKNKVSPLNITKTHIIGKIIKYKYPIKPKKKLIIIVAFITSFILAIFFVFFIEFIRGEKKDDK